jgi:hypothetical protein
LKRFRLPCPKSSLSWMRKFCRGEDPGYGKGLGAAGSRPAGPRQRPAEEQLAGAVAGCLASWLPPGLRRSSHGRLRYGWAGFYEPYPAWPRSP